MYFKILLLKWYNLVKLDNVKVVQKQEGMLLIKYYMEYTINNQ